VHQRATAEIEPPVVAHGSPDARAPIDPVDLYVQHAHPLLDAGLQRVLKWMVPARYDETLKKFPNDAEIR
jgi:hypothetical protein